MTMLQELEPAIIGLVVGVVALAGVWLGARIVWCLMRPDATMRLWGRKAEPEIEQEETD